MKAIDWAPLIEGMLEAVWVVDPLSLRIVAVNQAACQLQGLSGAEMIGRPVIEMTASPEDMFFWEDVAAGQSDQIQSETLLRRAEQALLLAGQGGEHQGAAAGGIVGTVRRGPVGHAVGHGHRLRGGRAQGDDEVEECVAQPGKVGGRIGPELAADGRAPLVDGAFEDLLGLGFTSLAHIFSPERIVMGGGVSQAFELLEKTIHATIRREAMAPFKATPVVVAQLGDNAGLVGVATLAAAALAP